MWATLIVKRVASFRRTADRGKSTVAEYSTSLGSKHTAQKSEHPNNRMLQQTIIGSTEISRAHLTPEIRLHLLTPNCPLYHAPVPSTANGNTTFAEPFWSIFWPGGQALARFVLDRGDELLKDKSVVLDLGAGCGAVAIAAKLRGARLVIANDIDPVACVAIGMNATLNDVRVRTSGENLLAKPFGTDQTADERFDVIFVGDLLYDEEIATVLETWLDEALRQGTSVFLGDPGRHGLTDKLRRKLRKLATYELPDNVRRENYGFDTATDWIYRTSLGSAYPLRIFAVLEPHSSFR
ncbi:electron transfer flavoprotein beta subunit lysine methyltransferase-like [Neodiprion virginianus]|uniref:electron transfer flavoprotein beta subunit lysine methyltransferase-like n=1 Tax=Neodiprion virginianus TaxID=2961670 RepID=UPI001EE73243|nr:electron transfer flavoprotein beta subunit lysine methyltransferase-like [Neodiprion virginianus]XP_046618102.1 electron transfer flavoprotein beta subunit lysine methyltransferase-like [Neodiprion virginianus]XP_046618103.1 electron transfer flavoprotein beta subunit lysine methyltransferase-like [Neodiprion virginianus]XP_046618104.1 electron transfer flavoprotein beta subunit lysine methyltransferase-like [Neodiprion virginianus]